MQELKQKGKNPDYPREAILWRTTEDIPGWLSDITKVDIDVDTGKLSLHYRETSTSREILDSSGLTVMMKIPKDKKEGGVLYSKTHPLIYLTQRQLDLLYETKKELRSI